MHHGKYIFIYIYIQVSLAREKIRAQEILNADFPQREM